MAAGVRSGRSAARTLGARVAARALAVRSAAPAVPGLSRAERRDLARVALLGAFLAVAGAVSMGMGFSPSGGAAAPTVAAALGVAEAESRERARGQRRGGPEYYETTVSARVRPAAAAEFLPLHREAGRRYGVSWLLLASIHRQETAFSTASTTYHGLNAYGCCAGPMQFNVTNGPVSTWRRYRHAYRAGGRPASYPHRTPHHPSIYDDFDAIMAAAMLLRDLGAGPLLDGNAWRAAYGYYGHDRYGITYANEVLARAVAWRRRGFCANCALDPSLVTRFDDRYGKAARGEALADEARKKKKKKRARKLRRQRTKRARSKPRRPSAPKASTQPSTGQRAPARKDPPPPPPPPAQTTTAPEPAPPPATQPPPPPPPARCSLLSDLVGRC